MKRLTLDQTWEQCLAMWKWISRRCKGKSYQWCKANVVRLKDEWIKAHGFEGQLTSNCFFCDRTLPKDDFFHDCEKCPAVKADITFRCYRTVYSFETRPRLFYAELKRLNKIRLAK